MPRNAPPLPTETPLVGIDRIMDWFWVQYFVTRDQRIEESAQTLVDKRLTVQGAAIGATPLNVGVNAGFYRVNVYARITRAATTSSSLTPTIRWTEGGVALSRTYTAMTGNTTTTCLHDVFPMRIDVNTSVTYETAYASVGATSMQYSLEVGVERLA